MLLDFPLSEIDRKQPFHGPAIPTRSLRVSAPLLSNPRKYNSPCLLPLLPSTCKQPVETSKPKKKPYDHHLTKNGTSNVQTLTVIITSKPHKKSSLHRGAIQVLHCYIHWARTHAPPHGRVLQKIG